MFIRVKCPNTITSGDVLSFDSNTNEWILAANGNNVVGIARTDAAEWEISEGVTAWTCEAVFSGVCYAKASQSIPDSGGALSVTNGAVYVVNQSDSRLVILPNELGKTQRNTGDLVRVNIR